MNGRRGQVCLELLLGIQNLQTAVEEVVVGKANTETPREVKGGNAQPSELTAAFSHVPVPLV